jgi:predicted RNA-binding Zn-ribbon protein involved in translation (DUF1610 family)
MIKPLPKTYHCPQCGWSKTIDPRSDALLPSEYVEHCPQCNNQHIEVRFATFWEITKSQILQPVKWIER